MYFSSFDIFRARYEDNSWDPTVRAWRRWIAFLKGARMKYHKKSIYITIHLLQKFCKWLFHTYGVSGETCKRSISGVNATLQWLGYGLNLHNYNSEPIVRTCKGIDKLRAKYKIGRKKVLRRAWINVMLDQMLPVLRIHIPFHRVVRAAILFQKQTGFRVHNVIMTKHGWFVRVRDLKFYPSIYDPHYVIATLPYAKNRPKHEPRAETRTVRCRCNEGLCAVHEVAELIRSRQHRPYQAVFLLPNGSPLTYRKYLRVLNQLCILYKLNPSYYTSHSLRYGQATDLFLSDWPIPRIMKWMGWDSRKSAMRYIRPNNEDFLKFGFET